MLEWAIYITCTIHVCQLLMSLQFKAYNINITQALSSVLFLLCRTSSRYKAPQFKFYELRLNCLYGQSARGDTDGKKRMHSKNSFLFLSFLVGQSQHGAEIREKKEKTKQTLVEGERHDRRASRTLAKYSLYGLQDVEEIYAR